MRSTKQPFRPFQTKEELRAYIVCVCDAEGYNADLNGKDFDTSQLRDFSYLFEGMTGFNCDISGWDVSKVSNLAGCFEGLYWFNRSLENWNLKKDLFTKPQQLVDIFSGTGRKVGGFKIPTWYNTLVENIKKQYIKKN